MSKDITISVVIPTTDRTDFLKRSIKSVLDQSYLPEELIVVIDGTSENSKVFIDALKHDSKVSIHLIETKMRVGGSEARNIGARRAKGDLVAFLDDDDEWLETKLEKQMDIINDNNTTISDPFICFTSLLTYNNPFNIHYKKLPNVNYIESNCNRIVDYLFETSMLKNIGLIQTSTILVPRWIVLTTPFTKGLVKHQDWDWLLKLGREHNVKVLQVEAPQTIYHSDMPRNERVGYIANWQVTKDFYYKWFDNFSNNGRYSFILNYLVLGLSELSYISKFKRTKWCISIIRSLPKKYLISLYTLKILVFTTKNILNK